jgi:hypothetical protein
MYHLDLKIKKTYNIFLAPYTVTYKPTCICDKTKDVIIVNLIQLVGNISPCPIYMSSPSQDVRLYKSRKRATMIRRMEGAVSLPSPFRLKIKGSKTLDLSGMYVRKAGTWAKPALLHQEQHS